MPVEMIGWIAPRISSEVLAPQGPPFSPDIIGVTAQIHEKADFDRALIGYFTDAPDGFLIGAHAAAATKRLGCYWRIDQASSRRHLPRASLRRSTI